MTTHHDAPASLKRTRITVDEDIAELIKALRAKGIDANEALRKGLRSAAKDIAGTARAIGRESAKRKSAIFFGGRCGDNRGRRNARA